MTKLPHMPIHVEPLHADTLHLSNEEFGAYMRLLFAMWMRDGELDVADLRRITGASRDRWPRLWERLAPFFDLTTPNRIRQKRLSETLERTAKLKALNMQRSAKASAALARKFKGAAKREDTVKDTVKATTKEPVKDIVKDIAKVAQVEPESTSKVTVEVSKLKEEETLPINRERVSSSAPVPANDNQADAPNARSPEPVARPVGPLPAPSAALLRSPIVQKGKSLSDIVNEITRGGDNAET